MASWSPPHDECGSCRFYKKSTPNMRCRFCGAGEFFEEKVSDEQPTDGDLMNIFEQMTEEGSDSTNSNLSALERDDDNDDRE